MRRSIVYRKELLEQQNSDFIPYTFQVPVSVVIAKVSDDFRLLDLVALDEPAFRPHVITDRFWRGWEAYRRPTWVTFNGRSFDLPLMELAAFRYGISVPGWFDMQSKGYQQRRNRYNTDAHLDLHDVLTNFGATRFHGGLNLAANLLGKPGKMDVQGYMVQDLYNDGQLAAINDYCRCDVLDTYFVFLRTCVLVGQLTLVARTGADCRDTAMAVRIAATRTRPMPCTWTSGVTGRTPGRVAGQQTARQRRVGRRRVRSTTTPYRQLSLQRTWEDAHRTWQWRGWRRLPAC